jgi:hypothetical protein
MENRTKNQRYRELDPERNESLLPDALWHAYAEESNRENLVYRAMEIQLDPCEERLVVGLDPVTAEMRAYCDEPSSSESE